MPAYEHLEHSVRCPVCDDGTLTPERLSVLREEVVAGTDLRQRQSAARRELQTVAMRVRSVGDAAARLAPGASQYDSEQLAKAEASAAAVLGEAVTLSASCERARELGRSSGSLTDAVSSAESALAAASARLDVLAVFDPGEIVNALANVGTAGQASQTARDRFLAEVGPPLGRVSAALNDQLGTSGWDALLRLARAPEKTVAELRRRHAVTRAKKEFAAHAAIERAKLAVFRDRFAGMSDEILKWWNRLRPDEPVVFERAEPRAGGRRFVDLKAKLRAGGIVEERDALGIFSDSQLNALGLAAFLARAILQGVPFVALDDPVQAGDDEHRDTFIDVVLPALVDAGLQVIVTSHDSHMRTLLSNVHQVDGLAPVRVHDDGDGLTKGDISCVGTVNGVTVLQTEPVKVDAGELVPLGAPLAPRTIWLQSDQDLEIELTASDHDGRRADVLGTSRHLHRAADGWDLGAQEIRSPGGAITASWRVDRADGPKARVKFLHVHVFDDDEPVKRGDFVCEGTVNDVGTGLSLTMKAGSDGASSDDDLKSDIFIGGPRWTKTVAFDPDDPRIAVRFTLTELDGRTSQDVLGTVEVDAADAFGAVSDMQSYTELADSGKYELTFVAQTLASD